MLFTTPTFLFIFLPIFLLVYFIVGKNLKNYAALIASTIFYAWGEPKFIFIILISIIFDWVFGNLIFINNDSKTKSQRYLILAIILNISLLIYFKYSNFFIENINLSLSALGLSQITWIKIALPIGVSFIVFEKITYLVDIYRLNLKPAKNLSSYALYILLFPKLLAGPIVKYHDIADQLINRKHNLDNIISGIYRMALGLGKKVLIADSLSIITDSIFNTPVASLSFSNTWLGILAFTLQIYYDFSGYSDMAIGMARIMGFNLSENFASPYISTSFTEFWRRWHISLSTWIKNYLYIPLGGNRGSNKIHMFFNLWVCFLISGLWHGANWTFIIWGLYHGFFLIIDKIFWLEKSKSLPKLLNVVITFCLIMIGWVIFRSPSLNFALIYIYKMFQVFPSAGNIESFTHIKNSLLVTTFIAVIIVFLPLSNLYRNLGVKFWSNLTNNNKQVRMIIISIFLFFFSIVKISSNNFSPFIYFRF